MFNNWCWAHWVALTYIFISIPSTAYNEYEKEYNFKKALYTFGLASVIAIIEIYVLHVGGFW